MTTRRRMLALCGVSVAGASAGCLGSVPFLGGDPITVASRPGGVTEEGTEATGYERESREEVEVRDTFELLGRSQTVEAMNWSTSYERSISFTGVDLPGNDGMQAGTVTVLTTPAVSILGRSLNPVATMSNADLAELVQSNYDDIGSLERLDAHSVTILGESTDVTRYTSTAELVNTGASVEVILEITDPVASGDDLVIGIGGYPALVESDEAPNVTTMFEAIEHPVDP